MDVVDILGGIDIPLTDVEVYYINIWVNDPDLQVDASQRTQLEYREDGQYHLNGIQTLAYCRTRNIGGDFGRTQQQRNAISLLWEKAREMSVSTLTELLDQHPAPDYDGCVPNHLPFHSGLSGHVQGL